MAKKDWNYATAESSSVGLMKCYTCGKSIDSGVFKYRETEEAFIHHHRACTESDPVWAKRDLEHQGYIDKRNLFIQALVAFISDHGYPDEEDVEEAMDIIRATGGKDHA